jgi:hypothetical protein
MTHLFLLMAGIGATHHHHHVSWLSCTSRAGCHRYEMPRETRRPIGAWHACTTSPAVTVCITFPRFEPKPTHFAALPLRRAMRTTATAPTGQTELWLVTWYGPTGSPMSSGQMPFVGASACGWDVVLGTRIVVAGIGSFVCLDREGFLPFHHADLFNVPVGTGYRQVTVIP